MQTPDAKTYRKKRDIIEYELLKALIEEQAADDADNSPSLPPDTIRYESWMEPRIKQKL